MSLVWHPEYSVPVFPYFGYHWYGIQFMVFPFSRLPVFGWYHCCIIQVIVFPFSRFPVFWGIIVMESSLPFSRFPVFPFSGYHWYGFQFIVFPFPVFPFCGISLLWTPCDRLPVFPFSRFPVFCVSLVCRIPLKVDTGAGPNHIYIYMYPPPQSHPPPTKTPRPDTYRPEIDYRYI